jgi:hypothetical protein
MDLQVDTHFINGQLVRNCVCVMMRGSATKELFRICDMVSFS